MMNDFWQKLVQQAKQTTLPFESIYTSHVMPLDQFAVIEVAGKDASSFLQNLLTNDVNSLEIDQSQYTGFCNPKGRLLALFLLIRRQDCYQIVLPKDVCQSFQQRLTMYVLRSKVTITSQSENIAFIGLSQTHTETDNSIQPAIVKIPDNKRGLLLAPIDLLEQYYEQIIQAGYQLAPSSLWESLDINAGIAKVTTETQEKFTPQQVNLDLSDGVSFKKGCYPGQEVVARLHYLGNPSRRMFVAQAKSDVLPAIGSDIKTIDGTIAGHIVNAIQQDANSIKVLASLKLSEHEQELVINDDSQLVITKQPEQAS
mgnify:CR=1 FL=1